MSLLKWLVIQFRQMFPPSNRKTVLDEVGGDGGLVVVGGIHDRKRGRVLDGSCARCCISTL